MIRVKTLLIEHAWLESATPRIIVMVTRASYVRRVIAVAGVAALALGFGAGDASADIYVYTDEQGVTHYSNVQKQGAKVFVKSRSKPAKARAGVSAVMPSDTAVERFSRYDPYIREAATLYQIPEELVRAVIKVESDYDPRAVSHAGAQGLMQLMPPTAARMQIRDSFDPRMNILAGTRYLRVLANTFNGDLALTVAGYNAGEGAVIRYGGIPPYEETQDYVMRVLYLYHRYRMSPDTAAASQL
jgi:soluble lytic murein transglycosylase-like protein